MTARRGDTKPLCHGAHASVCLARGAPRPLSSVKSLVLCQPVSPRTPRLFFSRPRRGAPFYVGLYGAGLLRELDGRYARRGRYCPGVVVQP